MVPVRVFVRVRLKPVLPRAKVHASEGLLRASIAGCARAALSHWSLDAQERLMKFP